MNRKLKLKKDAPVTEFSATERLLDENFIAQAIWECLKNNDPQGVIEIIETHLEVVNKVKAAHATELSRATMYHALKGKNPTIKTLAKLVNCCAA
jgi:DNA-binding phage protein